MSIATVDNLQTKAGQERKQLRDSVFELKMKVRENTDPKALLRSHPGGSLGFVAIAGFGIGYLMAGIFLLRNR